MMIQKLMQLGKTKILLWIGGLLGFSGGLFLLIILILFLLIVGIIAGSSSEQENNFEGNFGIGALSAEVLAHKPTVEKYAAEYGMSAYVPILLAIMQQESGGRGPDPMQSSESYCGGKIGCITDPDLSIKQGVIHFKSVLERAGGDVRLALQSYNFGGGFIDWTKANYGGKYSLEAAIQFSKEEYQREVARGRGGNYSCAIAGARELGACYGDYKYVERILKYVVIGQDGRPVQIVGDKAWMVPFTKNITSPFGPRWGTMHRGIDVAYPGVYGTPIVAFRDGVVVESRLSGTVSGGLSGKGYGYVITIDHGDGMKTRYGHMASLGVPTGTHVKAGQQIGAVGSTGNSSGPHLHFEILMNGTQVNPMPYLTDLLATN